MSITREQAAEIKARAYEHAYALREDGPRQWDETWQRLVAYVDRLVCAGECDGSHQEDRT